MTAITYRPTYRFLKYFIYSLISDFVAWLFFFKPKYRRHNMLNLQHGILWGSPVLLLRVLSNSLARVIHVPIFTFQGACTKEKTRATVPGYSEAHEPSAKLSKHNCTFITASWYQSPQNSKARFWSGLAIILLWFGRTIHKWFLSFLKIKQVPRGHIESSNSKYHPRVRINRIWQRMNQKKSQNFIVNTSNLCKSCIPFR